ncbi:fumarylacetoacetate hydrolase family protein [Kitasatospora kifunensis]|uniref:2-keto-4-pentenoate hydratase/2-oxohepta-3-ene-1,7-dioic acid hydratase in catechol pathway n=1 Tax=Kitasatospora kifunensis TaxID=58351 RepID=A0A7W7VZI7_KITKI|nr:fumarylacetoacetate hydrolase family protein [Kitasatospora kifunensis]MBB4928606.1 2-keto-4-pentenoate hydratase/2-oxohepta-3-ene-1,7-dioic acid hydratase in catechol pathway [Kitasatospora kifunensis]
MRIGRIGGRLALLHGERALDVERASNGRFAAEPDRIFERWGEFAQWAEGRSLDDALPFSPAQVGAPVLRPAQVFAIGLNYQAHVSEAGVQPKITSPAVFTKFVTSIAGPYDTVTLPSDRVDWEVELVAVIGRPGHRVSEKDGWSHVAGLTVGQDLSERTVQLAGPVPQFALGKSYPGFSPIGPSLVSVDEFADPDDLALSCALDGEVLQDGRTKDLIFSVPELVARLSAVVPLLPGDIIFTGTPSGVGMGRDPQRYLKPGGTLVSTVEGIGSLSNRLVADPDARGAA